jgi:hypothetical protein
MGSAFVDINRTEEPSVSRRAHTEEAVDTVQTSAVRARARQTVVNIVFAMSAVIAEMALTRETVCSVDTGGTVATGRGIAFVDVDLTRLTQEARLANTREAVHSVNADTAVLTRSGIAFVDVGLAEASQKASRTEKDKEQKRRRGTGGEHEKREKQEKERSTNQVHQ